MADIQVPGEVLLLRPDMHGLVVDKGGSGDFWKDRNRTGLEDQAEQGGEAGEAGKDEDNGNGNGRSTGTGTGKDDGGQSYDFDTDH